MSTSPIQEHQSIHSWIAHMKLVPKGWTCTRQDYWCVCLGFLKIKGQSISFLSAPFTEMAKVYMGGRTWQGHMLKWTWGGSAPYSEKWIRTRAQRLNRAEEMALIKKFIYLMQEHSHGYDWELNLVTYMSTGFPGGAVVKNVPAVLCGFSPRVERINWRRKWQPTPVWVPGKFPGQRSLVGYSP